MYVVLIQDKSLAAYPYTVGSKEQSLVIASSGGRTKVIREFADYHAAIDANFHDAFVNSNCNGGHGTRICGIMHGEPPYDYQALCTRLGLHTEEEDALVEEMGQAAAKERAESPDSIPLSSPAWDDAAAVGSKTEHSGDTRPEQGRAIAEALCASCGNAECTCEVTEPGKTEVSDK